MGTYEVIELGKIRIKEKRDCKTAEQIGLSRSCWSHKRKYPGTFTASELCAMAKLFSWTDAEIAEFIRSIDKE